MPSTGEFSEKLTHAAWFINRLNHTCTTFIHYMYTCTQNRRTGTAQKLVNLLNFGVLLFVLFAEPVHCGMFVGMCRVVVRVRAFHFDGFL